MKSSLGISDFLEEISSLSHSIVFLYFFALIIEEGFLISPCYSLELCIQMGISLFLFALIAVLHMFKNTPICCPTSHWLCTSVAFQRSLVKEIWGNVQDTYELQIMKVLNQ